MSIPNAACNLPTLYAVRALFEGTATADQQKMALEWIIFRACGTGEDPFTLGGEDGRRTTDFIAARQWAGRQIARLRSPEALAEIQARSKSPAPARKEAKDG